MGLPAAHLAQARHVRRDVVDLRMVAPAGIALLACLLCGQLAGRGRAVLAVIAAATAVCAAIVLTMRRSVPDRWRRAEQVLVVGVAAAVAAIVCGMGAVHAAAMERHPLVGPESQRATVTVDVTAVPRPTATGGVMVSGRIRAVERGAQRWQMHTRAVVFATGEQWLWVEPGTRVRAVMSIPPPQGAGDAHAPPPDEIVLRPLGRPEVLHEPRGIHHAAHVVRTRLAGSAAGLPGPADVLLPSMVLGDQRRVPPELAAAFLDAGLSHLAAVSGANIAYVLAGAVWCAAWLRAGRRLRYGIGALVVAGFVVTVGPEPSVVRAAAMAGIAMYAFLTGRTRQSLSLLATVVLVLCVLDPAMARSLGFLLSCAATAGIVVGASPLERRLAFAGKVLSQLLALAVVAHLATAPVLLLTDRSVPRWGIAANLLVAPVVPVVTVVGTAGAAAGALYPPAGRVAAWATVPALWWVGAVAQWTAGEQAPNVGAGR